MNEHQALFLSNAALSLRASENLNHVKNHLLWTCCAIQGRSNTATSTVCSKCCQLWSSGKFSLRLKSILPPGPRMIRILKKQEKIPNKLNNVEVSLLKRYRRNNQRKMVLSCHVCKHETIVPLKKRLTESRHTNKTPFIQDESHTKQTPVIQECDSARRRKRKKDRFAGLNVSAVISATPSPLNNKVSSRCQTPLGSSITSALSERKHLQSASPSITLNQGISSTPVGSRHSELKRGRPKSLKQKMNVLREELKVAQQNRVKDEIKALTLRNINVKKNNKLQDFLSKRQQDVHIQDRINSLLQL